MCHKTSIEREFACKNVKTNKSTSAKCKNYCIRFDDFIKGVAEIIEILISVFNKNLLMHELFYLDES